MSDQETLDALLAQNRALKQELENLRALEAQKLGFGVDAKEDVVEVKADDLPKIRELFTFYDTDQSGFIDASEFQFLVYDLGEVLSDEEAEAALRVIDTRGDGKLSFDDFVAWWRSERPANNKTGAQVALLKLKLRAKGLQRKATEVTQIVHAQDEAHVDSGGFTSSGNLVVGDFDGPAGMSIVMSGKYPSQEELDTALASYDVPANSQMFFLDLSFKDDTSAEDRNGVLQTINRLIGAMGAPPPGMGLKVSVEEISANSHSLRFAFHMPSQAVFLPPPVLGFLREFIAEPMVIEAKYPLEHYLNNPNAKLADAATFRCQASSKISHAAFANLLQLHPMAALATLFAGYEATLRVGSLRDVADRLQQFFADYDEAGAAEQVAAEADGVVDFVDNRPRYNELRVASMMLNAGPEFIKNHLQALQQKIIGTLGLNEYKQLLLMKGVLNLRILGLVDFTVQFNDFNLFSFLPEVEPQPLA
eukprot:TRINITY_DN1996_c0_g1_i1.p1 TRINITY_DN1996_c0_g1~~TRINITY_DN1996_c0_g1_i1.p1  ORF type:complete len:477 (+),score=213.57 TRINITY_DN1996_c0_g1_i1:55-1485(+)